MASGLSDEAVLTLALGHGAILITADKDFGELVFRQGRATHGVMLIRLNGLSAAAKAQMVSVVIQQHKSDLSSAFAVLTPDLLRIRRAP